MKVRFFYRDGDNYKCNWIQEVDNDTWNEFRAEMESNGECLEDWLDKGYNIDSTFEIYDFGLSLSDIPLIKEYGEGVMDHPYVSIVEYGEDLK